CSLIRRPPSPAPRPYPTLFRSAAAVLGADPRRAARPSTPAPAAPSAATTPGRAATPALHPTPAAPALHSAAPDAAAPTAALHPPEPKSTRLNSSHGKNPYAVLR